MIKKFCEGQEGEQFVDFIDSVKATIKSRGLPLDEEGQFILTHLDGPAKEEIKLNSKDLAKVTQEKLMNLLPEKKLKALDILFPEAKKEQ